MYTLPYSIHLFVGRMYFFFFTIGRQPSVGVQVVAVEGVHFCDRGHDIQPIAFLHDFARRPDGLINYLTAFLYDALPAGTVSKLYDSKLSDPFNVIPNTVKICKKKKIRPR